MGFDSNLDTLLIVGRMPAEVGDKVRLGVVKEVADNHNGPFQFQEM
jgi:hypothetical protein